LTSLYPMHRAAFLLKSQVIVYIYYQIYHKINLNPL